MAILQSDSGAAALGLMAGGLAYLCARLSRRLALALLALSVVGTIGLAPITGEVLDRIVPASIHEKLASTSSKIRIEIWKVFGAAARQEPVLGSGFGVSPRFPETRVAQQIPPEQRHMLAIWHPHSAALQIWVELGAIGAALALTTGLLVLRSLVGLPPDLLALGLALFAAVEAVSLVGHGAWQGWWPAAIGAAVVWFRAGREQSAGPSP
jgi:O-antigen ligase